jgi:DNA polymerase-3 subunit beta
LKELPDTALTFEINDENLAVKVTYINGYYDAMALNGDEFPEKAVNANEVQQFMLPAKSIASGIAHTLFAVGNDDMHPQFTGIYWDIKPDMIVYVASDSHKLVRYRQTNVKPNFERSFILPAKPAAILANIIDRDSEENVKITVDESSATFENNDYQLSCRFINGRYPNYNSVIPEDNPYTMAVDRLTLLNAVRRVAVFANVGGLVRLDLKPTQVVLTAQDVDHSTAAEETISCEYNGEPMNIGFKSADVIDVINNIDCDGVYLKLLDPARAGVFVPSEQKAGEELIVLQMPMMI